MSEELKNKLNATMVEHIRPMHVYLEGKLVNSADGMHKWPLSLPLIDI